MQGAEPVVDLSWASSEEKFHMWNSSFWYSILQQHTWNSFYIHISSYLYAILVEHHPAILEKVKSFLFPKSLWSLQPAATCSPAMYQKGMAEQSSFFLRWWHTWPKRVDGPQDMARTNKIITPLTNQATQATTCWHIHIFFNGWW